MISPSPGFHQPPALLPGETLILQQDKVTCVKTLSQAATGCLHLTNYRIIFSGNYMNVSAKSSAELFSLMSQSLINR